MGRPLIYFDYNATTPLDPGVREVMLSALEMWGNPSSVHQAGRQARAALDDARERASAVLLCKPSEIVFTSGGTESNNLAVLGTARLLKPKGRHILTSAIEHPAVLQACRYLAEFEGFEVTVLPVNREGFIDPDQLEKQLRRDTILVSIMASNNEIGTLQPVADVGRLCRERGVLFHTDAVQWIGKMPLKAISDFNADLVSICAHKIHGPKGVGALYIGSPLKPHPLLIGGSHENERRAGTENLAFISALVACLEKFVKEPVFNASHLFPLTEQLWHCLATVEGVHRVGSPSQRLSNTLSFVVERADSISLLAAMDLEGICASSGSACAAGSLEPSHVVEVMGYSPSLAKALVRFSLGRESSEREVQKVVNLLPDLIRRVQGLN